MEIVVTVVILALLIFAAYCFVKARKIERSAKTTVNEAEATRKQVQADLAAYRKIQQSHDTAMKKSRPVANSDKVLKPNRPVKSSRYEDNTAYGLTSYDSGSAYTDSGSSGGYSSDSSSSYSSGGSSYDSGSSSSSSSDSGSSSCD
jgi:uncharacterized membrane protein YgcG